MSDKIQEGIYFRSLQRPGPHWRLLLLNVADGTSPEAATNAIGSLWVMLGRLRQGLVDDLNPPVAREGDPMPVAVPADSLTCLLGFGARLFNPHAHPLPLVRNIREKRPVLLREFDTRTAAPFPRLPWLPPQDRRQHDADLVVQFIADTDLAVNRAIVETAKHIADQQLPLQMVTFFDGFNRGDHRSWIDFHDSINTMDEAQRREVIELVNNLDNEWMVGGTFLAFLRLEIDLGMWRSLTREQQELIVGRDKLTGCPLRSVVMTAAGTLQGVKLAQCPMTGEIPPNPPPGFIDAPRPAGEPVLLASHIHRANVNRNAAPRERASNRVYRQGYEFLEVRPDGRLSLGLNFISFQAELERITDVLARNDWLGGVNFGGGPPGGEPPDRQILALVAGGFYAVPPHGDPFPGAVVFD